MDLNRIEYCSNKTLATLLAKKLLRLQTGLKALKDFTVTDGYIPCKCPVKSINADANRNFTKAITVQVHYESGGRNVTAEQTIGICVRCNNNPM